MDLSIERFWKSQFANVQKNAVMKPYAGWCNTCVGEESYVPARLSLREGYDDLTQKIWLVSAPGAVGKSTLATKLCAETGAVYLDLANAATVGGNCITGGLVHAGLLPNWVEGRTALVIDALDEARLRVTQPAFEDFLKDVSAAAALGAFPIVLLGRVGIIEEAWTILNEQTGNELPILNIELFEGEESIQFVYARLEKLAKLESLDGGLEYPHLRKSLDNHAKVYQEAIHNIVDGLRDLSKDDKNNFVGYAPVLDAIAKVIAAEPNPSKVNDELRQVLEGEVLVRLGDEILRRETNKLVDQVSANSPNIPEGLYSPNEQLERLACRLFKVTPPQPPASLTPQQSSAYAEAVQNLLPQHPFLDGTGQSPSSAVFGACIISFALRSPRAELRKNAEHYSKFTHHAPNPFLFDFYSTEDVIISSEHIGLIFESVLAKSKIGEVVGLTIEGGADGLAVEITRSKSGDNTAPIEFNAQSSGVVRLGRRVSNVNIDADELYVEVGTGDLLELVAPVSINCGVLQLSCQHVAVKSEPQESEGVVTLEAQEVVVDPTITPPAVRGGAQLRVTWPDSISYPWTEYTSAESKEHDPNLIRLLRVFRRLVMAFRSHSKGRLARFKDKIEHVRMLKGEEGRKLLEKLSQDKVISLEGAMYYLDADALGSKTGASFIDVNLKNYAPETIKYVQSVL
ncbi:hypothetical protein GWQ44_20120 [Pseudomonas sp. 3MA1]|uniref:hypothetical protein n=1 Tax=Pseudomonas sp. 3MA1 TaxID=2699196 RepID=UPI0023DE0CCF|nr:hypothetical protein [Pseudomonas sp. 3MA1]MDF2397861.1 hypothetical protein [Pseudomonas sp. 3MA1]